MVFWNGKFMMGLETAILLFFNFQVIIYTIHSATFPEKEGLSVLKRPEVHHALY